MKVLAEMMNMLANTDPGSTLEADALRRALTSEEFQFLALAHKHQEGQVKTGAQDTKGMFANLRTEEDVAEKLGIKRRRKRGGAYGGPMKWGEGDKEDEKHNFVPLGFWERQKRTNKDFMNFIIYALIAIGGFIGIYAVVKFLL